VQIVFMGTPEFALPALQRLVESEFEVVVVYTPPDRPAGRGRQPAPSPVKVKALEYGLPVRQPARVSTPDDAAELASLKPDIIVVAAYGQILRPRVLDIPPKGVINIHPSLLPRHRGASPVATAILAGDEETGVTIMLLTPGMDEGPVLSQARLPIEPEDTTGTLLKKLAVLGANLLMDTLPAYLEGRTVPQPQDASAATYAPMVQKEDGHVDWEMPAVEIWRRVRAYNPRPSAFAYYDDTMLRILRARPLQENSGKPPGTVLPLSKGVSRNMEGGFAVQTRAGMLAVLQVQKEGRRALPADEFLRGERGFIGRRLH
jgi:methionyl-tRNA formyltransferase